MHNGSLVTGWLGPAAVAAELALLRVLAGGVAPSNRSIVWPLGGAPSLGCGVQYSSVACSHSTVWDFTRR